MSEVSHVVRTHHIDTGEIEMMCGEHRDTWEDPEPGLPMCGGCAVELVNLLKHRIDEQAALLRQSRRMVMRDLIGQEAQVEELTERVRKVEKRVKKAPKDEG